MHEVTVLAYPSRGKYFRNSIGILNHPDNAVTDFAASLRRTEALVCTNLGKAT